MSSLTSSQAVAAVQHPKLRQRKMDRLRRQREAELIRQLAAHTAAPAPPSTASAVQPPTTAVSLTAEPPTTARAPVKAAPRKKREGHQERLQVLEAGVDRLRRLEDACRLLGAQVARQQLQLQQLSRRPQPPASRSTGLLAPDDASPFSWMADAAPLAEEFTEAAMRQSLYSNAFLHSRLALLMVDVGTGQGLSANEAYHSFSGFTARELPQRQLLPPFTAASGKGGGDDEGRPQRSPDRGKAKRSRAEPRTAAPLEAVLSPAISAAPGRDIRQYPEALQLLQELYSGRRTMFTAVWRCPHSDGTVWENRHTTWVADTDRALDQSGVARTRPLRVVFASSYEEAVQLDAAFTAVP